MHIHYVLVVALSCFLIAGLVFTKVRPLALFSTVTLVLFISGVLSFEQFSQSYVNGSLVVLIGFVLLSSVLEKTIFLSWLSHRLLAGSLSGSLARLGFIVGVSSAFLNNTAVVAALMGPLRRQKSHPFKKLLLPLSYFSILGGMLTLVGTSTNLLVNGFVIQAGLDSFSLFSFSVIGLAVLLACGLVIVCVSARTLPGEKSGDEEHSANAFFIERVIQRGSSLTGKSVQENNLRQLNDLYLVEIIRDERIIAPVVSHQVLQEGDRLIFSGDFSAVDILARFDGLVATDAVDTGVEIRGQRAASSQLVEVVVSPSSIMLGRSVKEADFRSRFDAGIVAIRRGDHRISGGIGQYRFQAGDSLILSVGGDFKTRRELLQNFILVGEVNLSDSLSLKKSTVVLAGFLGVIAASVAGFPLVKGVLLLLGCCVAFGIVRINDLRRRFPFDLVLVIGGALCLAKSMTVVGLDVDLANGVNQVFGASPYVAYIGVFVLTWLLTELITNNAAAALSFPVAVATAALWGVSPYPFILAVIFGASASFVSPFGYQTNLMVFSVGQYKIGDYVKAGLPVLVVYLCVSITLIPLVFPF